MDVKVWRVKGNYKKDKTTLRFSRELIADKDEHARERILSELGSRHRVRRKYIEIKEVKEIRHEEVTNLDIRRSLGLESGA